MHLISVGKHCGIYLRAQYLKKCKKPSETVIRISDLKHHLLCAVYGKIAVEFKIGYRRFDEKEGISFSSFYS